MKHLITTTLLCLSQFILPAQQNNPLINAKELIQQAVELHDQGKYTEAIAVYKQIPYGDSSYYQALYEIGLSQMQDSQYVAALATVEKGLSKPNDHWPDFYSLKGNLIDDMGDSEKALKIYDTALLLYPANTDLHVNKGTTLLKMKRYKEAEEVLKQGVLINPYHSSCHYKLGFAAYSQGKIVPAFLSFAYYLLLQPSGRYQGLSITYLSTIGKAGDDIQELIRNRAEEAGDNFSTVEKILLSKIALDKKYEPLLKLDDPISRQLQVVFEKLEYDETDSDFWMQYYVPFYKSVFDEKKFEPFINRMFANVKIDVIQDYVKKKEKLVQEIVDQAVAYCDQIRVTRELNYNTRKGMQALYQFDNGRLFGKGTALENGEKLTGDWEYYYSPGNLSGKGRYDEKGERTGKWQYFHFNGITKGFQFYKDGKLEEREQFFYKNGNPSTDAQFKNDLENGLTTSYFYTGTPISFTQYKEGKRHGERKVMGSNGYLLAMENYRNDTLHGPFITYHKNGLKESEGSYENGKLAGLYKAYYDNGQLNMEGRYTDGELQGPWKIFHENGKLKTTETFEKGKINGEYAEYYDNNQLFYKCTYINGKASGEVTYYDRDSKPYSIYVYEGDVTKLARYIDKKGKEVGVSERKAKKLDLTTYYADGFKRSTATYNDKSEINGPEVFYFRSGNKATENNYTDGQLHGTSVAYYQNGNIQGTTEYEEGKKHGYHKLYFTHGQVEEEGWYQEDNLEGTWLNYNEQGDLSISSVYFENELHGIRTEYFPNGKKYNETIYTSGWIEEFIQYDTLGKVINHQFFKNASGKQIVLHLNGKPFSESSYQNGDLHGELKFSLFDGRINSVQYYKHGLLDSSYRSYHQNGKLLNEGQHKLGQRTGTWKSYYNSGKLNVTETYENGLITGRKFNYFENGKLDSEAEMLKGERHGWVKKYDETGNLAYHLRFEYDLPVAYSYLDKTGKPVPEIALPGGSGTVKAYYINGNVSAVFTYKDGKSFGEDILYHFNGKPAIVSTDNCSITDGPLKSYYANGQLKHDYNFQHGNLHGFYKEYSEKGVLLEEGYFYNGAAHDVTKIYDENGKLKETQYYYYGRLIDIKK